MEMTCLQLGSSRLAEDMVKITLQYISEHTAGLHTSSNIVQAFSTGRKYSDGWRRHPHLVQLQGAPPSSQMLVTDPTRKGVPKLEDEAESACTTPEAKMKGCAMAFSQ